MAPQIPGLVVDLNSDGDNAAPASPEVRSPSHAERRRTKDAAMKTLVQMMGQRKQEMKALAYDATFQEFQQKAAADASAATFTHAHDSVNHETILRGAPIASTLELISRAGKAQNRTQSGVWSAFGKTYVCLGAPDVTLNDTPPVKRGDHALRMTEQSTEQNAEKRGDMRDRVRGRNKQSLSQTSSRRSSISIHDAKNRPEEEGAATGCQSDSRPLPPLRGTRRDRVPFSEIMFPREPVHLAERGKRHARARASVMGTGPGFFEDLSANENSSAPPSSTGPSTDPQQKFHSSRSAVAEQALLTTAPPRLVINTEPLRLPPPQLQSPGSKRGSSAPGSPHSTLVRRGSHARASTGAPAAKPPRLPFLSPVAHFMMACASAHERSRSPRGARAAGSAMLQREFSAIGHAAMVRRKSRDENGNAPAEQKSGATEKRPISSLAFEATVPKLHTEFEALRHRMRDDLKARLETLRARRERCILSPRFMGTMSKLLVSEIRNVGRSYPISTSKIWDLAETSLQESAELLRKRKEEQQNNALNVFYVQLCALVQAQNTTDPFMILLVQKIRSLLESGWALQRPLLLEICRFIAQVEESTIFGSNPCLLPVLHFIRRRLCLPVPELTRILRDHGIVFGSAARAAKKEMDSLGNMTRQKLKPV